MGNTSRVWSKNFTVTNGGSLELPAANAFDGTFSECFAKTTDPLQLLFEPSISGTLEIYIPNGGRYKILVVKQLVHMMFNPKSGLLTLNSVRMV